jgi:RHS repeat-associated protein
MVQTGLLPTYVRAVALISASSLLILLVFSAALGQGSTPQRGFQPGASFALSDIETINTTNGNLMLSLPLGKLPAGRGGLSGQVNLHYDSKLYDSQTQWYQDWDHLVFGEPHVAIRNMLVTSNEGGWHYGTGYSLQLIDRMSQYPAEIAPQYPAPETIYHYKVKVAFPDGSLHEFMPRVGSLIDQGYSDIRPDGYQSRYVGGYVQDVPYFTNNLIYYTFDGTYIRLEVQHDSDSNPWNNPWTLTFPDGMKVTNLGSRITDRNGNYVEFSSVTYNGHLATQLMDQLGRKIIIEFGGVSDGEVVHVPGVGGADLTYQVHWKGIQVFKSYSTVVNDRYSPTGYPDMLGSEFVVSRIDLPSATGGLQYLFGYNAADSGSSPCCTPSYGWGELNSVTTPTGAQAQYQYQLDGQNGPGFDYTWDKVLRNQVTQKTLTYQQQYDGNSTPVTETWTYGLGQIINPDGGIISQWNDAQRNYRTETPDGTVVEKLWAANRTQNFSSTSAYDDYTGIDAYDPSRVNGYVKTEFTSIKNAGGTLIKTAIKDYNYDKNGNVTRVVEYDWVDYGTVPRTNGFPTGIPAGAVVKRVTTNTLAFATPDASDYTSNDANSYWTATAPSLRNAVAANELSNGSATLSRSEFTYDNAGTTGNVTQQKTWDSAKGAYSNPLTGSNSISVSNQYDGYGNPILSTDARGYQTQFVYGSVGGFTDLYPTQVKTGYQTSVQRTDTREYDFYTGAVTRTTDVDNNVSSATTYDVFGRPTLVKAAEGKPEETRTSTTYSDVNRRVIVKSDLNTVGDEKLVTIQHYDQLGRVRLVRQLEDAATQSATDETTGIKVQTRYQYSGNFSYVLTSNAYRAATSATAGSEATMGWSRAKSDNGGHVIEVQTFAGATAPAPWGANTSGTGVVSTAYDGDFTTVTDQAGKVRRSMIDGLGRLTRVDEPDASGSLGTTTAPAQPTSYGYDAFANLTTVNQGSQTRSFGYSSLSRLTFATNPESGTISYQYDGNGNLTQKTDARGIITTYEYDALNRSTSVNYSNTTIGNPDVPDITRFYDGATNGKGRFWYSYTAGNYTVGNNVEHTSIDSYDALGRPKVQRQLFKLNGTWSPTYQTSRAYNLAGSVTTETYPSGHTITNTYDTAGRASSLTGNLGDGANRTYATNISYSSSGALAWEQFGTNTPLYHKLFYNSRGQFFDSRLSSVNDTWDWNRGRLILYYSSNHLWGQSGTDNNGNVRFAETWIPPENATLDQADTLIEDSYSYDSLNRITSIAEQRMSVAGGWGNWQQQFRQQYTYDRYGNRTIDTAQTWGTGINNKQFTVDTASNRLGVPVGQTGTMSYDQAGNLITDTYTGAGARQYDAENRMTRAWGGINQWQEYAYDADGQRVRRKVDGQETWQIYGIGDTLVAEYASNGAPGSPQKEYGYRNDQLLVTAEPVAAQNVSWTNVVGVSVNANSLTKTAGTGWGNAGASSTQSLGSGDGYVEVTATETSMARLFGFSHTDADQSWPSIDFGIDLDLSGSAYVFESGNNRGNFGPYATGDKFQVAIVGGVVKYKKNGTVFYTSSITPTYPLVVDTALHGNGCTLSNVVLGSSTGTSAKVQWLVPDHLGTPRMIVDQTGTLANLKRHDYLPFGEELFAPSGGRSVGQGYAAGDGLRQHFTQKERDVETGLDYFGARYYASAQGRFTSTDPSRKSIKATTPQTWNRYNYTLNNPVRYVDENGKWPTDTHNRIIEKAFRTLDPKLVRHIQRGSESVDRLGASPRTLYESNAPQHAMTPGYKVKQMGSLEAAKDWARNEATHFINANMSQAKDYYQKSNQTNDEASKLLFTVGAFESFGKGAHTIMDGGSPAHRDFQVYDVRPYEVMGYLSPATAVAAFAWDMKAHADTEARQPTDAEMNKMVDDLRMQFLNAFGKEAYEKAVPEEDRRATEERKKKQEQ